MRHPWELFNVFFANGGGDVGYSSADSVSGVVGYANQGGDGQRGFTISPSQSNQGYGTSPSARGGGSGGDNAATQANNFATNALNAAAAHLGVAPNVFNAIFASVFGGPVAAQGIGSLNAAQQQNVINQLNNALKGLPAPPPGAPYSGNFMGPAGGTPANQMPPIGGGTTTVSQSPANPPKTTEQLAPGYAPRYSGGAAGYGSPSLPGLSAPGYGFGNNPSSPFDFGLRGTTMGFPANNPSIGPGGAPQGTPAPPGTLGPAHNFGGGGQTGFQSPSFMAPAQMQNLMALRSGGGAATGATQGTPAPTPYYAPRYSGGQATTPSPVQGLGSIAGGRYQ